MTLSQRIGQRFGKLVIVNVAGRDRQGHPIARCKCDCGNMKDVSAYRLYRLQTRSCGCLWNPGNTTHGKSKLPEYRVWKEMRKRCYCKTNKEYPTYGALGVRVCKRWNNFQNFITDMGSRPEGTLIDRMDPKGNYEPTNCRWATTTESGRNKRNSFKVSIGGKSKHWMDWCDEFQVPYAWAKNKLDSGIAPENVFCP